MFLARVTLYATLGYLIDGLGAAWTSWQFWCIVGLFLAAESIARIEAVERVQLEIQQELERLRRMREPDEQ